MDEHLADERRVRGLAFLELVLREEAVAVDMQPEGRWRLSIAGIIRTQGSSTGLTLRY